MKFWDASAVVPLLLREGLSERLRPWAAGEPLTVWWATEIECASAVARRERDHSLSPAAARAAWDKLAAIAEIWTLVEPSAAVRADALRFLRVHPLRAADALQLAAAFVACERQPEALPLVTLDGRLAAAARREGFPVLP